MASNPNHNKSTAIRQKHIPNTPIGFLLYISKPEKWWAFSSIGSMVIAQLLGIAGFYVIARFVDSFNEAPDKASQIEILSLCIFVYLILIVFERGMWRASGYFGIKWLVDAHAYGYRQIYDYIVGHSHSYFSDRFAGALSNKVSHAADDAAQLAERAVWSWMPELVMLVSSIVLFATIHWSLAAVTALAVVALFIYNVWISKHRHPHVVAYANASSRVRGDGVDLLSNISAARQYSRRGWELSRLDRVIEDRAIKDKFQWFIGERLMVVNTVVGIFFTVAILFVTYNLFVADEVSVGMVVLIISLLGRIGFLFAFLGNMLNGFIRLYGECQEGLDDILLPYEIVDEEDAKPLKVKEGEITFANVSFDFEGQEVFKNLSLSIKPGERVGLVGASGAGKTTFVSLLLRQHDVMKGEVLIDGQNIKGVLQDTLRQNMAVVPQEPALFHRSIAENIQYGNPKASQKKVIEVAKMAEAHSFVTKLPQQYDTLVGERGVKLSGGQKQRVAIARAMLKDAPILVLDEATSALDSESEVSIQRALQKLMKRKTVIAIAHRLSTLREMDRIIVLDKGNILEEGTHEELAKAGGIYERLWNHQAGGFLQE